MWSVDFQWDARPFFNNNLVKTRASIHRLDPPDISEVHNRPRGTAQWAARTQNVPKFPNSDSGRIDRFWVVFWAFWAKTDQKNGRNWPNPVPMPKNSKKPQKICENWVLLVFHSQNCWGIISSGFLLKHIGIREFGHILGTSTPCAVPRGRL